MERLTKNKPLRLILGAAALAIGFTGQTLLTSNRVVVGVVLFALAVILIILALRKQEGPLAVLPGDQPIEPIKHNRWGYAAGGLAILLAILAFGLFASSAPSIYPWLLYLASVVLLIAAIFILEGRKQPNPIKADAWSWLEIGFLLVILAAGVFMRLYLFNQVPFGTWYDEADNGLNALRILNSPGFLPVYAESTNLPAHFIYLIALSFRVLGVSTLSIRAVSVLFGLGTVAAGYLAGRELFNRRMGLVVAFLLAISRWDVNWSRIGMHGVTVPFFALLTTGLVLRALRRQQLMDYALAGLSMGLSLGFYTPLRLFPVVVGIFVLVVWYHRHNLIRSSWQGFLVLFVAGIIAATPILYLTIFKPGEFFSRMETVSIFTGKTPQEGWQAVAKTTAQHLLMFNYKGDSNGRHNLPGLPMLDPIIGTLMVLGVGLCLWQIRRPGYFLLLAWLLMMLAPGIFSLDFEAPQSLRAIGSLPAAYLLAAVPINGLWQEWEESLQRRLKALFLLPLILVLGISGYINYNIYFNIQAKNDASWAAFSAPETIAAKIMAKLGNSVDYYISTYYYQVPTIKFLAPAVSKYQRWETNDSLPVTSDGKKGVIFLVDGTQDAFLHQAKRYYPRAAFTEFTSPGGVPVLYEVYLHPADILASLGLTASYYHDSNWAGQPFLVRTEKNLDFDWKDGVPAAFPFSVEWKGVFLASSYGDYQISTLSPVLMQLTIDGVPIIFQTNGGRNTAEVSMAKGTHAILIRSVGAAGHYEVDWKPPSENEEPIPASAFQLPPITDNGLLGKFYANGQWSGEPAFTEVDPNVDVYFQVTPLDRPYTVEWTGNIQVPSSGYYLLGLECRDSATLWIDNKQVLDDQTPDEYKEAGIDLEAGLHALRIRYSDHTGYTHIYLYWTPPGAEREIIPQEVLFPPAGEPGLIHLH